MADYYTIREAFGKIDDDNKPKQSIKLLDDTAEVFGLSLTTIKYLAKATNATITCTLSGIIIKTDNNKWELVDISEDRIEVSFGELTILRQIPERCKDTVTKTILNDIFNSGNTLVEITGKIKASEFYVTNYNILMEDMSDYVLNYMNIDQGEGLTESVSGAVYIQSNELINWVYKYEKACASNGHYDEKVVSIKPSEYNKMVKKLNQERKDTSTGTDSNVPAKTFLEIIDKPEFRWSKPYTSNSGLPIISGSTCPIGSEFV